MGATDRLIEAIIRQESRGNPRAVSPAGARGLMQVMPSTAQSPGYGLSPVDPEQLFDPDINRRFGTEYFNKMMEQTDNDTEAALIAYNAGLGNAQKFLSAGRDYSALPMPEETQPYVENVMKYYHEGLGVPPLEDVYARSASKTAAPVGSKRPVNMDAAIALDPSLLEDDGFGQQFLASEPTPTGQIGRWGGIEQSLGQAAQQSSQRGAGHWTQALAGVAQAAGAGYAGYKRRGAEADRDEALNDILSGGNFGDPARIAQISELDPGLGRQLLMQSAQEQSKMRLLDRQAELSRGKSQDTELVRNLRAMGIDPASPEGQNIMTKKILGREDLSSMEKGLRAAGYQPGTQEYEAMARRLLTQPELVAAIENSGRDPGEFAKQYAKSQAGQAIAVLDEGEVAQKRLPKIQRLKELIPQVRLGMTAQPAMTASEVLDALGVNLNDMPSWAADFVERYSADRDSLAIYNELNSILNENMVSMIGPGGFPANNFSNTDREFLLEIQPRLTDSNHGAMAKVAMLEYTDQLKMERAQKWQEFYRSRGKGEPDAVDWEDFNKAWAEEMKSRDGEFTQFIKPYLRDLDEEMGILNLEGMSQEEAKKAIMELPPGELFRHPVTGKTTRKLGGQ